MRRERSSDRNLGPPLRCPPAPIRPGGRPPPPRPARAPVGWGRGGEWGKGTAGWGEHGWVGRQGMGWHIGNRMEQLDGEGTAG